MMRAHKTVWMNGMCYENIIIMYIYIHIDWSATQNHNTKFFLIEFFFFSFQFVLSTEKKLNMILFFREIVKSLWIWCITLWELHHKKFAISFIPRFHKIKIFVSSARFLQIFLTHKTVVMTRNRAVRSWWSYVLTIMSLSLLILPHSEWDQF